MNRRSLRFRLLSAAFITTLLALVLAGVGLVQLFKLHLERRAEAELEIYLSQLIGRVEIGEQDRVHITRGLVDPRFETPLSGLYWQVQDDEDRTLLRSRSLWDSVIPLPVDELLIGEAHQHTLPGPAGQQLMVRERQIILRPSNNPRHLRIVVARDRGELDAAGLAFTTDMLPYFGLLALFLMIASYVQVRTGLKPLEQIRRGVMAIRADAQQRLSGDYPEEVTPLVEEIHELLDERNATVEKARAWTGDLAHGLKTPLSALGNDAQRLREAGQTEIADDLDQLAQSMRRRVDRELIRARLRSAGPSRPQQSDLTRVLNRLLNTLQRSPEYAELAWINELPEPLPVCAREDDLTEMLGNLLDNAGKWANHTVRISWMEKPRPHLCIEDDGPGVPSDKLDQIGERGLRLDQQTHGYGLGLAIVRDIADAYGAKLEFAQSQLGGLAVRIEFACSTKTV